MTPAPRDTPSAAAVADLRTVLGREAVARAAGACRLAIVDRWAEGRHRPRGEDAHRMAHLAAAVATLRAAGVPRDALTALLATPDSGLGGRAPLDAIAAGEGERVVGWAAARAGDGAPVVTVRADGREVTVRRVAGDLRVDPPEAAGHPLVAAVVAQLRATAGRPRRRASC